MGNPDAVRALGDVSALPTLLLFDQQGRSAGVYIGSASTLHREAEEKIESLLR